jgi:hypothetical protein
MKISQQLLADSTDRELMLFALGWAMALGMLGFKDVEGAAMIADASLVLGLPELAQGMGTLAARTLMLAADETPPTGAIN